MKLKPIILFLAVLSLSGSKTFAQITKSLWVQSPCASTLIQQTKKDLTENDLTIFPNPNDGQFKIHLGSDPVNEEIKISVINGSGQTILDKKAEVKDNIIEIDLRHSSNGIYMIRLIVGKNVIRKKFIISF